MNRQLNQGVTLIELMVVVTIIAILAAITIPTYRQTVVRSNRTEAKTALMEVSQNLEKCFTRYNAYDSASCAEKGVRAATPQGHYAISAPTLTATTYVLRATPLGEQASDAACGALALDQRGGRYEKTNVAAVPANKCW